MWVQPVCKDLTGLQVGLLLFGAFCIMTIGLASATILPMHLYRYDALGPV